MKISRRKVRALIWGVVVPGSLVLIVWILIPEYHADLSSYRASTKIYDSKGRVLRTVLGRDDVLCEPVPLARTGDWIVNALVSAEDKRFFEHSGVDVLAIGRASAQNLVCRRVVSGASTLSTLVVKLTEPRPRTVWTKVVEANHALDLEAQLSKKAILEQYINRAPFGGNIYGVESASKRYFGKSARDLSLAESAMLVGLPQSPSRLRPDRHPDNALKRRDYVLTRMLACDHISADQFKTARKQVMTIDPVPLPFHAPHFCDFILDRYSGESVLKTTLDMDLQLIAEDVLSSHLSELSRFNIHGGAVVIIDVRTGALRAMVGSPDFWNRTASGQVNATTARRSPGSTLKPFAYAAAMEQGMCTPATMTADVPANFAGYSPRNFNLNYAGPVSVRRALVRSLNIPALRCAQQVGLADFVQDLRSLGFSTLDRPAIHYGLSIVVGTCEVTLLELANAYACLARSGEHLPLRFLQSESPAEGTRVYSEETAYMIADILSGEERARDLTGHIADVVLPRIAWKTGTSTGYRDAWTVAYNPDYVVGVWIGNPDGAPSRKLVGAVAATPVAGDVFRRIYPHGGSPWYEQPKTLKTRQVCARSGQVPGSDCPAEITDYHVPELSLTRRCDVHQRVRLSGSGSDLWAVREVWPPQIESFLRDRGMQDSGSGEMPEKKVTSSDMKALRITSPTEHESFRLLEDMPAVRQELKLAAVSSDTSTGVYWFIDGELYCAAKGGQPVFWPLSVGKHTINCSDALGNCDGVDVIVE
jgi:penicillin-binding protein 1C